MKYQVNAVDARGNVVSLELDAPDEPGAAQEARGLDLTVLSLRPRRLAYTSLLRRGAVFPVTLFSLELMSLLDAGLNLVEALQALGEKDGAGGRHGVLAGILSSIARGESFSRAVSRFPQHFSPLYVATLRASERTGDVREALARFVAYQQALDLVRKKAISACIYPAILLAVGLLVIGFLMFYVVPRFAHVYEDFSGTLPFFSAALLAVGGAIHRNAWAIAGGGLLLFFAAAWAVSQSSVRAWLLHQLWRMPGLGAQMKVYQLARLYRTVGMLLRAGIPVVQALGMIPGMLPSHLRRDLRLAERLIQEGRTISSAFSAAGLATPVAFRMMVVGERSGGMGEMMEQIARFHDEEIARYVEWFTRAFEPLLMAGLGIAIGVVVVLMYMPIFELAGSIR
jgi:general secretion pathway protein F